MRSFSGRWSIHAKLRPLRRARRDRRVPWKVQARESSLKANRALSFRFYLKEDPACLFGNKFRETVSPFDHGDTIAKKVIIEAKSREGLLIFNAKKIEMVNRQSAS